MMKGIILLADGVEDVEAIGTVDVLKRANIEVCEVSVHDHYQVITSAGHQLILKKTIKEISYQDYDFLILPGGKAVNNVLMDNYAVHQIIDDFCIKKKLVCAICAAPLLLNKHHYLKGVRYTCFKGYEKDIDGIYVNENVVTDQNFISARSMYYSCDFGLKIIEKILGYEKALKIQQQIKSL